MWPNVPDILINETKRREFVVFSINKYVFRATWSVSFILNKKKSRKREWKLIYWPKKQENGEENVELLLKKIHINTNMSIISPTK